MAALALAACGGGDDTSSPSTTMAARSTAAGPTTSSAGVQPAPEGLAGVLAIPVSGANHVTGKVSYPTQPPAGGDHNPVWQNCGLYTVSVTDEYAVHSLEHGAVWVTYKGELDGAARDALTKRVRSDDHLLVSRYDANPTPFVLTAWGRQLRLDAYDDAKVGAFIDRYAVDGPTVPEKGAACKGGIGSPPDKPLSR